MQPPANWLVASPLVKHYFKETFDIVSVEAFAYKSAYALCFTIRKPKWRLWYRILCCDVHREDTIYTAMDPALLGLLLNFFRHNGREEELDGIWHHLRRNLKDVPAITHQLCFANMSVMFKYNGQTRIHFVQKWKCQCSWCLMTLNVRNVWRDTTDEITINAQDGYGEFAKQNIRRTCSCIRKRICSAKGWLWWTNVN